VLIETENAAIAMQNVADGKADVAIHTLFGASYMIDRYFRDRLKIGGHIGDLTAKLRLQFRGISLNFRHP
jgi:two-component system sensor histidine kinase EvgS